MGEEVMAELTDEQHEMKLVDNIIAALDEVK